MAQAEERAPVRVDRELFEQLAPGLRKRIYGYTGDWHSTEDLLQETFLRAVRHLDRFDGRSALTTWIFSIARNLCLDYLRSSARCRLRLLESLETTEREPDQESLPESLCQDPDHQLESDERCVQVRRALAALTPEARAYLVLRIYWGLSYREIARVCRIPPNGVGTRISRALRSFSEQLG
jgi:RNA polymerase sigma-70 factor (ECF subfamily)